MFDVRKKIVVGVIGLLGVIGFVGSSFGVFPYSSKEKSNINNLSIRSTDDLTCAKMLLPKEDFQMCLQYMSSLQGRLFGGEKNFKGFVLAKTWRKEHLEARYKFARALLGQRGN